MKAVALLFCVSGKVATVTLIGLTIAAVSPMAGCATDRTRYIRRGDDYLISPAEVDIQDIQKAADELLASMLKADVLKRAAHSPAQIVMAPVINDTSSRFDVGDLLYRMREQLVNSGQAQVVTTWGSNPEDPSAQRELQRRLFWDGDGSANAIRPDFSLAGKITRIKRQAANTFQTTHTFRLTLTSLGSGLEAWTQTVEITKQGTKSDLGF